MMRPSVVRWSEQLFLLLMALALAAFAFDVHFWHLLQGVDLPGDVRDILAVPSAMVHGAGALFICLLIWRLDMQGGERITRVIAATLSTGAVVFLLKVVIGRFRPLSFSGEGVTETFAGWFPLFYGNTDSIFDRTVQSLPSGHTATAAALAWCLTQFYPRGRSLFIVMAFMVAVERMHVGAHYLSDVVLGAAIGLGMSQLAFRVIARRENRPNAGSLSVALMSTHSAQAARVVATPSPDELSRGATSNC